MAQQQPQPRSRLEPDQLSALWKVCDSDTTAPLEQLIEKLEPGAPELGPCLSIAIQHGYLNMIRFLLEQGVGKERAGPVDGYFVRQALRARSIPVLEIFMEFGWEVNSDLREECGTALKCVTSSYLPKLT
jgi:hypothetical protein